MYIFVTDHLGELVTDQREVIKIYLKGIKYKSVYIQHTSVRIMTFSYLKTGVYIQCTQIMGTVLYNCGTVKHPLPKTFRKSMQINTFLLGCKILGLTIPHEATILFIFFLKI